LVALGVWSLDLLGLFAALDAWAYDVSVRIRARLSPGAAQVLLVEIPRPIADAEDESLVALAGRVRQLGASHMAFSFLPSAATRRALVRDHGVDDVTFGLPLVRGRVDPRRIQAIPHADNGDASGRWGAVWLPAVRGGIYREQLSGLTVDDRWIPTLEWAVARGLADRTFVDPGDRYRVHFRGGPGSLPCLSLDAAQSGSLVHELVAGRVVLFGLEPDSATVGIATSTTSSRGTMSLLEYHGHALNTLLTGHVVRGPSALHGLLLMLAVSSVVVLVYQACTVRVAFFLTLLLFALDGVLAIVTLAGCDLWLPWVQLGVVQFLCFALVFQRKSELSDAAIETLLLDLSAKLRHRRWPTGFFEAPEPWSQVLAFIHQTLNLNRLIILERPDNAYHLREIRAVNCTLADIDEQRRDYRRWPYAAAVDAGAPLRLSDRLFLKAGAPDERQYLVALTFGGELFGFMALGVAEEQLAEFVDFEPRLQDFADQIAELLYRRQVVLAERAEKRHLGSMFNHIAEANTYNELIRSVQLMERRLTRLENMFEKSPTAAAIYDLFGRLLMVNDRMSHLLESEGLTAVELTTVDLVAALSKRGLNESRRLLRHVVMDTWQESVPIRLDKQSGAYVLNIRPLQLEVPPSPDMADNSALLQLQGVLCEVIDRSSIAEIDDLKDRLTDLAPCVSAAAGAALGEAIRSLDDALRSRGVTVRRRQAEIPGYVLAAPNLLPRVFAALLDLLLSEASDDSQITISAREVRSGVAFLFSNRGFGVAEQWFSKAMSETGAGNGEFRKIREALGLVKSWDGRVTATSEIGEGSKIQLVLRR
jgi:hypothetical protein